MIDARDEDALYHADIVVACAPLLVAAPGAARLCGVGERTWRKLDACARVPRAVAVGRRRLWSVATLRRWTELGCPERSEFEMRESTLTSSPTAALIAGGARR